MATIPSTPQKKTNLRTLPPKRGRIKAEMFKTLMKKLSRMASKPGQPVEKNRGEGSDSASATPPPTPTAPMQTQKNPEQHDKINITGIHLVSLP